MPKSRTFAITFGALLAAASLACTAPSQTSQPTAREIVKAIQDHIGIPWMAQTVDTFKAGDPDTPVTGIAVTMMATLDVLHGAAANQRNFIITHEPTFYSHK